jgi:hypothetical protein
VYAIDAYTAYHGYNWHTSQKKFDALFEEARERLAPYDHQLVRCFSLDALKLFPDRSLDFVYIDSNHEFGAFFDDMRGWRKKVRIGGIVSGHDYQRHGKGRYVCEVKDAVLGYTYAKRIRPWFATSKRKSWLWVEGS